MANRRSRKSAPGKRNASKAPVPYVPRGITGMQFKRTYAGGAIALTANDAGRGFQFNVGLMPGIGDLLNVFDYYRIDKVDVTFTYVSDTPAVSSTASLWPIMAHCIDYDDDNAPATYQDVLRSNLHAIHYFGEGAKRSVTRSFQPRANYIVSRLGTSSTGLATGLPGTLIDLASPDVPHYGLKVFLLNYNSTTYPNSRVFVHSTITATFFGARSG